MSNCEHLDFYKNHGIISNPLIYKDKYDGITSDIDSVCKIVQGLLLHEHDGDLYNFAIPETRKSELHARKISDILNQIFSLDSGPILKARDISCRKIATCRDFSLLACSILRNAGIPARVRYGFGRYFYRQFLHDTTVLEYWNHQEQKWHYADVSTTEVQIIGHRYEVNFDIHNIPNDQFITASQAWVKCRNKEMKATLFGGGSMREYKGLWYVRNKLIQDLASLNKDEMLLWDCWGYPLINKMGVDPYEDSELCVLDKVATILNNHINDIQLVQSIYLDQNLTVPSHLLRG